MSVRKRKWATRSGQEREAWIVDYTDGDGIRRLKTFDKKKDADKWSAATTVEVGQGIHVVDSNSVTVKEAAEEWIAAVSRGRGDRGPAEASTLRQCNYHVDKYINPRLGRVKLSQLTKPRVMSFRDDLLAALSRSLAKKVLASLKGILSEAQDRGRVAINAASRVKIGDGARHREEVAVPAIADIKAILAKLDELAKESKAWRRRQALLATAIHTGIRASEVRGLPWEAVDLKQGNIQVIQRADENGVVGKPKSKSSYREINIPADLVKLLRAWKVECPKGPLVFPTQRGNPESLGNIYNRAWKPIQLGSGVADQKLDEKGHPLRDDAGRPIMYPRYNFHALRHFHASLLIHDGANPKDIQVELGHSSIQVTFDLYGHLFKDEGADRRRTERSERLAGLLS